MINANTFTFIAILKGNEEVRINTVIFVELHLCFRLNYLQLSYTTLPMITGKIKSFNFCILVSLMDDFKTQQIIAAHKISS